MPMRQLTLLMKLKICASSDVDHTNLGIYYTTDITNNNVSELLY